jgi:hypothetical protein
MRSHAPTCTPDKAGVRRATSVLLYRSTDLAFTVPPLFEIDHLRLRPSLFDLFI